jgi:opacity protein-like surface antigen
MKGWLALFVLVSLILIAPSVAGAQAMAGEAAQDDDQEGVYVKHDEDDWDEDETRYALGVGFGLVNLDEEALSDDVEPYFNASLRIRIGHNRGSRTVKRFGMQGFFEPEIGYWEASEGGFSSEDLLVGVNVVGVTPLGGADFFVGGGIGLHFSDTELLVRGQNISGSNESIGLNAQFGVDVHVAEKVSLFGVGRFDIVEDRDDLEAKAYVGARFYF